MSSLLVSKTLSPGDNCAWPSLVCFLQPVIGAPKPVRLPRQCHRGQCAQNPAEDGGLGHWDPQAPRCISLLRRCYTGGHHCHHQRDVRGNMWGGRDGQFQAVPLLRISFISGLLRTPGMGACGHEAPPHLNLYHGPVGGRHSCTRSEGNTKCTRETSFLPSGNGESKANAAERTEHCDV